MGSTQLDEHSTAKLCSLFLRELFALGKKKVHLPGTETGSYFIDKNKLFSYLYAQ